MSCELMSTCPFFNEKMPASPQTLALYRARYCRGENAECARYLVFSALGRDAVPLDLYPNDRLQALKVVRSAHTNA